MNQYLSAMTDAVAERERLGLRRTASADQLDGVSIDLAGNDYLGLRGHPEVAQGAIEALHTYGSGAGASRLVTGTQGVHIALEEALADFLGHEAGLIFSTGYHANLSLMATLGTADTVIISDAHNHASLIDGMRLAKARVAITKHLDLAGVQRALEERAEPRAVIVVESIFSVLGDAAPLAELAHLAATFDALLVVDEAHGLGVVGQGGAGLVRQTGILNGEARGRVITTVTLSKALASQGGAVCGPAILREHLLNVARPFIFDTGLAPASAGAALAALRHLQNHPEMPARTREIARQLAETCRVDLPAGAVLSVPMSSPEQALAAVDQARMSGLRIGCFRPPSTPDGISRLRITAHAGLSDFDLEQACGILKHLPGIPDIQGETNS